MKNLKNNIIIICLLALVALLSFDSCKQRAEVRRTTQAVTTKNSIISRVEDERGRESAKVRAREFTITQLKASRAAEVDSLKKEVGRLKGLKSFVKVYVNTTDTITTTVKDTFLHIRVDTITKDTVIIARKFDYYDNWLKLHGVIIQDSLIANYSVKNEYSITHRFGRGYYFNDNNIYITVKNNNPNTTTAQIQTFKIKERKTYPVASLVAGFLGGAVTGWIISEGRK